MFRRAEEFLLSEPTAEWMSRTAGNAARESAAPGSLVLNRYLPVRPLGSGGSGSVWLAREVESGRDVALKIVAARGNGWFAGRARGRRGRPAAAPALPARARARARRRPRLHRLRVRAGPDAARGDTRRGAERRRRARSRGSGAGRPRARPRARHRPPRRQAGERPARRWGRHLREAVRLRPRSHARGGGPDRRRRHPRDAGLHLARAAPRGCDRAGRRRLGRRRRALGGARRFPPLLDRHARGHRQGDRQGRTDAPGAAPRPAAADRLVRRPGAVGRPRAATDGRGARRLAAAGGDRTRAPTGGEAAAAPATDRPLCAPRRSRGRRPSSTASGRWEPRARRQRRD